MALKMELAQVPRKGYMYRYVKRILENKHIVSIVGLYYPFLSTILIKRTKLFVLLGLTAVQCKRRLEEVRWGQKVTAK